MRQVRNDYSQEDDKGLMDALLYYLNKVEVSDSGREFRPNYIRSCRVLDTKYIGEILKEMEYRTGRSERPGEN